MVVLLRSARARARRLLAFVDFALARIRRITRALCSLSATRDDSMQFSRRAAFRDSAAEPRLYLCKRGKSDAKEDFAFSNL
jgi:hypothetical protein